MVWAGQTQELIKPLPNGHMNWSQGTLDIRGTFFIENKQANPSTAPIDNEKTLARRKITPILLKNMALIKINAHRHLSDMMMRDAGIRAKLSEMASVAPLTVYEHKPDGSVEICVQLALHGGLAQLILPSEIKQVESIKAVGNGGGQGNPSLGRGVAQGNASADPEAYTGLIVDARGIGAQPALVPVLMDENGKEVYSPVFISREYAVHNGVCHYVQSAGDSVHRRTGAKPLVVKGLRTVDGRACDIVISNADASRLHGASAHLTFLKQCRVIIVLD